MPAERKRSHGDADDGRDDGQGNDAAQLAAREIDRPADTAFVARQGRFGAVRKRVAPAAAIAGGSGGIAFPNARVETAR